MEQKILSVDFLFLFSRFSHFYSMSPNEMLAMPARLFFAMEKQICRIRAESDLRRMAVTACSMGGDGAERVRHALVVEQGEVFTVERSRIVQAEPGAMAALRSLM